jgi:diguanylate cyclase (GGDEF)-like protein
MGEAVVLDRRRVLAGFYALGSLLCLVPALVPGWTGTHPLAIAGVGAVAVCVAAGLLRRRVLPVPIAHLVLGVGTLLITAVVFLAGGGAASATFSLAFSWVALYAALFMSFRAVAAHVLLTVAGAVVAVVLLGEGHQAGVQVLTLAGISGASACVVRLLMSQLRATAGRDELTGLLNRRGLTSSVSGRGPLGGADRAAVLLVDLDRFHVVNASLGPDGGDALLRKVAAALVAGTPAGAAVARVGGDEFAILMELPALRREQDMAAAGACAREVASVLLNRMRGPFTISGVDVEVEARVGIAVSPEHGSDLPALLRAAGSATSRANEQPDRIAVSDERALGPGATPGDLALLAELRAGICRGELRVHYQPLLEAHTRTLVGVEALVRWQHPIRGLLSPELFVPHAEPTGLVVSLTQWVLAEALRQTAAWRAAGVEMAVSANLSARLLLHPNLPALVSEQLRASGLPPAALTLEVTESAVMTVPERAEAVLAQLAGLGVRLSIDDFGTGYTSLALLTRLPVHELKIDRSFVAGCTTNGKDLAVVHSVLELAHRLGMTAVAEGVEDADTADLMVELGADLLQGYHLGRPVPAADLLSAAMSKDLRQATPIPRLQLVASPSPDGPGPDDKGTSTTTAAARR